MSADPDEADEPGEEHPGVPVQVQQGGGGGTLEEQSVWDVELIGLKNALKNLDPLFHEDIKKIYLIRSSCATHGEDDDNAERSDTGERQRESHTLDPHLGCKLGAHIGQETGEDLNQENIHNMSSGVSPGGEHSWLICFIIPSVVINLFSDHLHNLVVMRSK